MVDQKEIAFEGPYKPEPVHNSIADSAQECKRKCEIRKDCKAWAYFHQNGDIRCNIWDISMREYELDVSQMSAGQQICQGANK